MTGKLLKAAARLIANTAPSNWDGHTVLQNSHCVSGRPVLRPYDDIDRNQGLAHLWGDLLEVVLDELDATAKPETLNAIELAASEDDWRPVDQAFREAFNNYFGTETELPNMAASAWLQKATDVLKSQGQLQESNAQMHKVLDALINMALKQRTGK